MRLNKINTSNILFLIKKSILYFLIIFYFIVINTINK